MPPGRATRRGTGANRSPCLDARSGTYWEQEARLHLISIHCETGVMRVTRAMIEAARRAEYDFHQRECLIGAERFIPTPDAVIRAMLEAVLKTLPGPPQLLSSARQASPVAQIVVSGPPEMAGVF